MLPEVSSRGAQAYGWLRIPAANGTYRLRRTRGLVAQPDAQRMPTPLRAAIAQASGAPWSGSWPARPRAQPRQPDAHVAGS
ncbi:hypothetical protein GCM10010448_40270 [Streptomyces glomeratus]|uniref:Uncharacterized protein n=1 Tax=Streptomyces glomeratus TaxID=284452 RepID=A0ABP6LR62_9ACTN